MTTAAHLRREIRESSAAARKIERKRGPRSNGPLGERDEARLRFLTYYVYACERALTRVRK